MTKKIITKEEKRIKDLLYLNSNITTLIYSEIDEIIRGRGRSNKEVRESLIYRIDEALEHSKEINHE